MVEFQREGFDAVYAVSNTQVRYWRKGDRFKALSPEENQDFQDWLNEVLPRPSWVPEGFLNSTEWSDEPAGDDYDSSPETLWDESSQAGDESEDETTLCAQSECEVEPTAWHPLPETGHLNPGWTSYSSVDYTGHMFLIQMAKDLYAEQMGHRRRLPACNWVMLSTPSVFLRLRLASGEPVPELKLTNPEGQTGWLEDITYYGAADGNSWADGDDDEEEYGTDKVEGSEDDEPWFPDYDPYEAY